MFLNGLFNYLAKSAFTVAGNYKCKEMDSINFGSQPLWVTLYIVFLKETFLIFTMQILTVYFRKHSNLS